MASTLEENGLMVKAKMSHTSLKSQVSIVLYDSSSNIEMISDKDDTPEEKFRSTSKKSVTRKVAPFSTESIHNLTKSDSDKSSGNLFHRTVSIMNFPSIKVEPKNYSDMRQHYQEQMKTERNGAKKIILHNNSHAKDWSGTTGRIDEQNESHRKLRRITSMLLNIRGSTTGLITKSCLEIIMLILYLIEFSIYNTVYYNYLTSGSDYPAEMVIVESMNPRWLFVYSPLPLRAIIIAFSVLNLLSFLIFFVAELIQKKKSKSTILDFLGSFIIVNLFYL
jgi:hypothetical protein